MKKFLSITALLAASFCFAGSIANERTELSYLQPDKISKMSNDQDTTMNRQQTPKNNRKRDMGDTSQMRPDRRTDTTNLRNNMPVDSPPGSMPKHRM
ncbi:MAG: hypothetical protein EOP54_01210 [Sphingobacteriales bacterium]|nr:MAG: hypothetical protein EOP54_01210 [Sphingobacteriales bacterium]